MNQHDPKQANGLYRFIRGLFIWIRNYFIFIGVLVTAATVALTLSLLRMRHETDLAPKFEHTKEQPAYLKLDLSGPLLEHEPSFADLLLARFFQTQQGIYLPEVRAALRRAGLDDRVASLELKLGALEGSQAAFSELRRVIAEFKSKDKSVFALLNEASDWNYYVGSVADRIVLNPASPVTVMGPVFNLIYFGDALRKLGVGIDVVRAGKYKSAFEPLVSDRPSEATLEQYEAMNQSLLAHIVDVVANARKKTPEEVLSWYQQSIFTAEQALQHGLIDGIGYSAGEMSAGDPVIKEGPDRVLSVQDYAAATRNEVGPLPSVEGAGGIALIEAVGEIGMSQGTAPSDDDSIAPEPMRKRIRWALEDDDVKAVVLRVSSPGGSAIASDMIWHELTSLAAVKPLVVSMGAYAASGGYYISAPARRIIAEPTTITGSIGVIGLLPNFSAFKEKYGVSFYVVTESLRRSLLNPGTAPTDEDKALVDATIDQVYKGFLEKVAQGRKMQVDQVAALAQGRVYTGLQGKELGLVDEIGGIQEAFNAAKELSGLDANKLYPVLRYEGDGIDLSECLRSPLKMLRCLQGGDVRSSLAASALLPPSDAVMQVATRARRWLEISQRERVLTLWPGYVGLRASNQ